MRHCIFGLGLLVLVPTTSFAQKKPAYFLQSTSIRKVEATYTYEVRYPNLDAKEWELVVAKPRDLPAQLVTKVTVEPAATDLTDLTDLKQRLFRCSLARSQMLRRKQ